MKIVDRIVDGQVFTKEIGDTIPKYRGVYPGVKDKTCFIYSDPNYASIKYKGGTPVYVSEGHHFSQLPWLKDIEEFTGSFDADGVAVYKKV